MKLCKQCHTELDENNVRCDACGTEALENKGSNAEVLNLISSESQEIINGINNLDNSNSPLTIPFFKKKWFLISSSLLVIMLIAVTTIFTVAANKLNSSPKQLYLYSEYNTLATLNKFNPSSESILTSFFTNEKEKPLKANVSLEGEFKSLTPMLELLLSQLGGDINGKLNVELDVEADINEKASRTYLNLKYKDEPIYEINYSVFDGIELTEDLLTSEAYYWDNESNIEDDINDIVDSIQNSNESLETVGKLSLPHFDNALLDEYFTIEKKVEIKTENGNVKADILTLNLDELQFNTFINTFIEGVRKDEELLAELIRYNRLTNVDFNEDITVEDLQEGAKELLDKFNESDYLSTLNMIVKIDKNKRIIDRSLNFDVMLYQLDDSLVFNFAQTNNFKSKEEVSSTYDVTMKMDQVDELELEWSLTNNFKLQDDAILFDATIQLTGHDITGELINLNMDLGYTTPKKENEIKQIYFDLAIKNTELLDELTGLYGVEIKVGANFDQEFAHKSINKIDTSIAGDINFSIKADELDEEFSYFIDTRFTLERMDKFSKPTIPSDAIKY